MTKIYLIIYNPEFNQTKLQNLRLCDSDIQFYNLDKNDCTIKFTKHPYIHWIYVYENCPFKVNLVWNAVNMRLNNSDKFEVCQVFEE